MHIIFWSRHIPENKKIIQHPFSAQDLYFDDCTIPLSGKCTKTHYESDNQICQILNVKVSAVSSYVSNFQEVPGSIKVALRTNSEQEHHEFLNYVIENRPTSQCHVVGSGHVITFDEQKFQIFRQNWYILNHSNPGLFRVFVKFRQCGEYVCPCALFAMEGDAQWFYFDFCTKPNLMIERSENMLISSARGNNTFFVSSTILETVAKKMRLAQKVAI